MRGIWNKRLLRRKAAGEFARTQRLGSALDRTGGRLFCVQGKSQWSAAIPSGRFTLKTTSSHVEWRWKMQNGRLVGPVFRSF